MVAKYYSTISMVLLMATLVFVAGSVLPTMSSIVPALATQNQQNGSDDEKTITYDHGRTIIHERGIPIPPNQSSLKVDNILLGRQTANINGGLNIIDQEATTTSHVTWSSTCCVGWDDAYFLNGLGTNGYFYQCGLMHRNDPARWVMNVEVFDSHDNNVWNSISSTTIPSETSVRIKHNVPAYGLGSGVQCEFDWGSTSLTLSYTQIVPASFQLSSSPGPSPHHIKTSWHTEYTTSGDGVTIGSVTYNSPKFVDTNKVTQAITQVNEFVSNGSGSDSYSGVVNVSSSPCWTGFGYKSCTSSTGTMTTSN